MAPEIVEQLIELGQTASAFPPKVKDMATGAGLSLLAVPKAAKALATNIKYLAGAPNDVKSFVESVKGLMDAATEVFSEEHDHNHIDNENSDNDNDSETHRLLD